MKIDKIYEDLLNIPAISGFEENVRNYMEEEIKKYKNYEIKKDKLGSIFAFKKSKLNNVKTVMVAGHMDEVGFIVVKILETGAIKLQNIGGISGEVFISQVMNVYTKNGIVKGIIASIPPHLKMNQSNSVSDLVLDVGASSKKEVMEFGIKLGDMVLFDNIFTYTKNENRIISKAIDNRYGCGLALEAVKKYDKIDLPFNLVIGATAQEEVGLRGAETSANLFNPDVFIALDASPVNDLVDKDYMGKLGNGFLLRMYDPRNVMPKSLMDYFVKIAEENKIKYQYFVSKGGTDAAKTLDLNAGILSTTIGLPARYIHSTAGMFDITDLLEAKKMLFSLLDDLTNEKITDLQNQR